MFDKLDGLEKRFEEINGLLYHIGGKYDHENYKNLLKELKELSPIVKKYKNFKTEKKNLKNAEEIITENKSDLELREIAEIEIRQAESKIKILSEELKIMMMPKDPDDSRNVIMEIRCGTGGEEAALFAERLLRMYGMYAQKNNWKTEILSMNETGLGGFKEVSFMISGNKVYSKFKFESGVHRVQRVPETESQGRIHTSAVTVAVLPEAQEAEVQINPIDLKIDTYRAGGAGGQHVNKTESAIRITHLPTGFTVECQDERSQYKNKEKALKILKSRLLKAERDRQAEITAQQRRIQVGSGDRSERIRTYNFPQNRVTDHRISLTLYRLEEILNGDLDEIINALIIKS
jgi:peptide chain release factor 1